MPVLQLRQTLTPFKVIALVAAFVFLYSRVLTKLGIDWWTDENYSHGLLVPFVIGIIIWSEWNDLEALTRKSSPVAGGIVCLTALLMLAAGVLGAELFATRISMVLMLAGVLIYLFGRRIISGLAVPFALLLLSIPIPQILFNKVAFPLQILASKMAVWGIRMFDVPTLRSGNVIDILPAGASQPISLEVVEACSGIRSLMTLITLALVLAYFTRRRRGKGLGGFSMPDLWRALVLMICAVPVAVITNAGRVTTTGLLTYHYGKQAAGGTSHDASGWIVYLLALVLLILIDLVLIRVFSDRAGIHDEISAVPARYTARSVLPLIVLLTTGGIGIAWLNNRGEVEVPRQSLSELPVKLGNWEAKGSDIRFDGRVEGVLGTTDYVMREYASPDGRIANIYVGYYSSQRTGATYHSPQNCLPGAGWVMSEPGIIEISTPDGRYFNADRYIVENGTFRQVMIYWYQGRGRTEASEYIDKFLTIRDSILRRRSDGALVRVMTTADDIPAATRAAADLSARLAEDLNAFVPD